MNQIYTPPLTPMTKKLLIVLGSIFFIHSILFKFFQISLANYLALNPAMFFSGHIYTIFTYPFISTQFMSLIFSGLVLWLLGSDLESLWGEKLYRHFLLTVVAGGALIYLSLQFIFFRNQVLFQLPLSGLSGVTMALTFAYAMLFPERQFTFMFLFPLKAKYFCLLLFAISIYSGLFSAGGHEAWGHLGSAITAALFMRYRLGVQLPLNFKNTMPKIRKEPSKKHLSIVKEQEDEKPPKYWQ